MSTRKEGCQTVEDEYEDVVVTKKCTEVVTTTCTQISQTTTRTSDVVDISFNLVQAGGPKPPVRRRREVEAEAEAKIKHDGHADAHDENHDHAHAHDLADSHEEAVSAPIVVTTQDLCNSVPENSCKNFTTRAARSIPRRVCVPVVDVTTIQDCTKTYTKHCQHTSFSSISESKVLGEETKVRNENFV